MGARQELNGTVLLGSFLLAGLLGLPTGSGAVFFVPLAVLVGCAARQVAWALVLLGSGGAGNRRTTL